LAALRVFFEYVGQRFPDRLGQAQKVAFIPRKRTQPPETVFLERDEIESTLALLPVEGSHALRDRTLLVFLYMEFGDVVANGLGVTCGVLLGIRARLLPMPNRMRRRLSP
jgi:site-specific recombinase XerD